MRITLFTVMNKDHTYVQAYQSNTQQLLCTYCLKSRNQKHERYKNADAISLFSVTEKINTEYIITEDNSRKYEYQF